MNVTTREDILLQLTSGGSPDFGTFHWHNLSSPSRDFLALLWNQLSRQESKNHDNVHKALLDTALDPLEPGQIAHLAALTDEETENKNLLDLWRMAREDSRFLSHSLGYRGNAMRDVLVALVLTTEPFSGVAEEDLAFVLLETAERPGEIRSTSFGIVLGNSQGASTTVAFPRYSVMHGIAEKYVEELEFLLRRRYVVRDHAAARYNFAHPSYRAAAEFMIIEATVFGVDSIEGMASRALLSLSPTSASAASKQLSLLRDLFERHNRQSGLLSLAMSGMRSMFPAARDNCFSYLNTTFEMLAADQKEHFLEASKRVHIRPEYVLWHNGHAWINPDDQLLPWTIFKDDEDENIDVFLKVLRDESKSEELSPAIAFRVVKYLGSNTTAINYTGITRLLTYEESLIRGEAAKVWLKVARSEDSLLIESIFSDKNPTVIMYALEGVILGWGSYGGERRKQLLPHLNAALANPVTAFLALDIATRIYKKFHGDASPPWDLWVHIASVLLRSAPSSAFLDEARFYYCATRAIKVVDSDLLIPFLDAWVEWVERQSRIRSPSDFMLSVTEVLVEVTSKEPTARQRLMSRLLKERDTSFIAVVIKDCIINWELLTESERAEVVAVVKEERNDSRWIRSVAFTREFVPAEIQTAIVGRDDLLDSDCPEIIKTTPRQLLEDSIAVTTGHPGILHHVGLSGGIGKKWIDIRNWFLGDPTDPVFDIALREVFQRDEAELIQRVYEKFGSSAESVGKKAVADV